MVHGCIVNGAKDAKILICGYEILHDFILGVHCAFAREHLVMTKGIQPQGEQLRNAVRWLSDNQDYSYAAINEAARKFDLSPLDTEFLIKTFAQGDKQETSKQDQKK